MSTSPGPGDAANDEPVGVRGSASARGLVILRSQMTLATVLIVATLGSTATWLLGDNRQEFLATGIYFVLIPGLLAALVSLIPLSRNQTGMGLFRGTTIGILASAIVLREGFICVLIALPLVLPIAGLAVYSVRSIRRGRQLMIPLLLIGLSGEGIVFHPPTHIDVTRERTVEASWSQVDEIFQRPASLPTIEPLLLRAGFPTPIAVDGDTSRVGDRTVVRFDGGGRLELVLVERNQRSLTWEVVNDTTPIAGWLALRLVTVEWDDTEWDDASDRRADSTELRVAIRFERILAPAFYFDPIERWGVGEMGDVILDMMTRSLDVRPVHGDSP